MRNVQPAQSADGPNVLEPNLKLYESPSLLRLVQFGTFTVLTQYASNAFGHHPTIDGNSCNFTQILVKITITASSGTVWHFHRINKLIKKKAAGFGCLFFRSTTGKIN